MKNFVCETHCMLLRCAADISPPSGGCWYTGSRSGFRVNLRLQAAVQQVSFHFYFGCCCCCFLENKKREMPLWFIKYKFLLHDGDNPTFAFYISLLLSGETESKVYSKHCNALKFPPVCFSMMEVDTIYRRLEEKLKTQEKLGKALYTIPYYYLFHCNTWAYISILIVCV